MMVEMLVRIDTKIRTLLPGQIVEIPDVAIPQLGDKVRLLPTRTPKEQKKSPDWPPTPRAWLQDGELRTAGVFEDLASEIVTLTNDDLDLQCQLLTENCQQYAPTHIWQLVEKWKERAAIMEHDAGMSNEQAEEAAARLYKLLAFLPELRRGMLH